jgi:DNA polymerase (family 10)
MADHNKALAELFRAMAELLVARRQNPHRIRAYQRAADVLMTWPEDVGAVSQQGRLREIPGIGKELAGKIEEFLQTGRIRSYEELRTGLPAAIARWTELPGLSEAAVQYLYFRLGIRTLSDLEVLVRSHLLRTLPGVTGSEEELLEAIRKLAESAGGPEPDPG